MSIAKLTVFLLMLAFIPHQAFSQQVLFRTEEVNIKKYHSQINESGAKTPQEYYTQLFKNSEIPLDGIDACQKKIEKSHDCQAEIESLLQFPLNLEAKENLIVLMQDLSARRHLKKSFLYSKSFLDSLKEKKRKSRIASLRIRGAEVLINSNHLFKDIIFLRNGNTKKFNDLLWLEDEYSQWTILTSFRPPIVLSGFLKQLLDKIEALQGSSFENCNQQKEVYSGPRMPPQFEVVNHLDCAIRQDLLTPSEFSSLSSTKQEKFGISRSNRNIIYFAGGIALALFINDFMRDKRIIFNASF